MSNRKYRIVIGVPMWSSIRDLLRSDVLKVLKKNKCEILLISPNYKEKSFIEEFEDEYVSISEMYNPQNGLRYRLETYLNSIGNVFLSGYIDTFWVRYNSLTKNPFKLLLLKTIRSLPVNINRKIVKFITLLRFLVMKKDLYSDILNQFKPNLVVCNFALGISKRAIDRYLMVSANKLNIPVVVQLNGWDNLTTKGTFPFTPDRLLVWTDIMKDEAKEYHRIEESRVVVTGCPGHDVFYYKEKYLNKTKVEFCEELGLDSNKKIITYATGGFGTYPNEAELIKSMYEVYEEELKNIEWQMIVRPHPVYKERDFASLSDLCQDNRLFIDFPGKVIKGGVGNDLDQEHLSHFVETLHYSDLILNYSSTINIDACAANTPVINLAFTHKDYPIEESPLKFSQYIHNKRLLDSGNIPSAISLEHLAELTRFYLEEKKRGEAERKKIVDAFCWKLDGKSGTRVAGAILNEVKTNKAFNSVYSK